MDLESAYRHVPVHPDDRHLLGMRWRGNVCLDAALPFGLRSAPKIFSAVADALLWVMYEKGVTSELHYLDDFLLFGRPGTSECARNLSRALLTCQELEIPVAENKVEGPSTALAFLGIEIDTEQGILRMPSDKLTNLQRMLQEWLGRRASTKRELLQLIGSLSHATSVVKPGRIFLRRLIDLSTTVRELHYYVRLNRDARSDIRWWATFITKWNGQGMLAAVGRLLPSVSVQSDASGSWGCGAVFGSAWVQVQWPASWQDVPIATKEMVPVVLAAIAFGKWLKHCYVLFESDNTTVVSALRQGTCREPGVMHLLRTLHFVAAFYNFTFTSAYLPGPSNSLADAISRNVANLCTLFAQLDRCPLPLAPALVELVLDRQADWTSGDWSSRLHTFLELA